jgi:putative membrane protein
MIVYDKHRWSDHLLDVKGSMVREIMGRVAACVAWSGVVVGIDKAWTPLSISATPHSLVGVVLGLLLVFRTNSSYGRFWEGRRLWGGIVNESRNLTRAARLHLGAAPALAEEIGGWTVAFARATMHVLRDTPVDPGPLAIANRITDGLAHARNQGAISDLVLIDLDQYVRRLVDNLGGCERIHRTPLPFVYMVHLRRALIAYCYTLPLALVKDFGWSTVVVTLIVAYLFFGIEEIGVEIEDPFSEDDNDLPLDRFCDTIEANVRAILADKLPDGGDAVNPLPDEQF